MTGTTGDEKVPCDVCCRLHGGPRCQQRGVKASSTLHLLMPDGFSRCGNVSQRPGWNRGFAGPLTDDELQVTCKTCLRLISGTDHHRGPVMTGTTGDIGSTAGGDE